MIHLYTIDIRNRIPIYLYINVLYICIISAYYICILDNYSSNRDFPPFLVIYRDFSLNVLVK